MFRREIHAGRPTTLRGPLRLLALLLVAGQIGVVPAVALADSPPTPTYHADHVGNKGDAGCEPFHDELTCLACRVLSNQPLGSAPAPALPVLAVERDGVGVETVHEVPGGAHLTILRVRAPPYS